MRYNIEDKWDTIPEVDYKTLKEILDLLYTMEDPPSLLIFGPPGIGKTQIVTEFAKEKNMDARIRFLSRTEPTDWLGIPKTKTDNNEEYTVFVRPKFLRGKTENRRILFFFDEINTAPPQVLNSALDVILNKRVEEYELPKDTMIVAAGNYGKEDGTYVEELSKAVKTRFIQVRLNPDLKQWLKWAKSKGIHSSIIDFLSTMNSIRYLLDIEGLKQENAQQVATPRGWEKLSDLLYALEKKSNNKKTEEYKTMVTVLACGILGKKIADEFCTIYFGVKNIMELIFKEPGYIIQEISKTPATLLQLVRFVSTSVKNGDPNQDKYVEKLVSVLKILQSSYYSSIAQIILENKNLSKKIQNLDQDLFNNILTF
ncbi:MAG: AAA family ATPase [Endomicrobia bacterium]|nr:AAA family ATPase [Endomicrobiia bacterium]MDW8056134.1 AAA family ATPase [Elusimicrobiota bacterium]